MVKSQKADGSIGVNIGVNTATAVKSVKELKSEVAYLTSEWRTQDAQLKSSGQYMDAAKAKYEGLSKATDAQKEVIKKLQQEQKGIDKSTTDGAIAFNKYEKQINDARLKLDALTNQTSKAKQTFDLYDSGIVDHNKNIEITSKSTKALVDRLQAEGKEVDANKAKYNGLKSNLSEMSKLYEKQEEILEKLAKTSGKSSKEYKEQEIRVNKLGTEIAKTENEMDGLANAMEVPRVSFFDRIKEKLSGINDEAKDTKSTFKEMFSANVVSDAFSGALDKLKDSFITVDVDTYETKIVNALGLTEEKAAEAKEALRNVYADGFGESIEDVSESIMSVNEQLGDLPTGQLEEVTKKALMLRDTFDMDTDETLRGVNSLMTSFGMNAEEAMNYITVGAQNGLNKTDELGDNLAEYATLFQENGYSASEMFEILQAGLDGGAYNLDKVNDLVKEFGIRMTGGEVGDAVQALGGNFDDLYQQIQDGGLSSKDAFQLLASEVSNLGTEQEKAAAISAIFGTQGEDAGIKVIDAMTNVEGSYEDVKNAAAEVQKAQEETFSFQLKERTREFQTALEPVGKELLSLAKEYMPEVQKWLGKFTDTLKELGPERIKQILTITAALVALGPVAKVLGTSFNVLKGIGKGLKWTAQLSTVSAGANAKGLGKVFVNLKSAASGASKGIKTIFTVMKANPWTIWVTAIAAVVGALFALYKHNEKFRKFVDDIVSKAKDLAIKVGQYIKKLVTDTIDRFSFMFDDGKKIFRSGFNYFKSLFVLFKNFFTGNWKDLGKDISNVVRNLWSVWKSVFKAGFNFIDELTGGKLSKFVKKATNTFDKVIKKVKDFIEGIKKGVSAGYDGVHNSFAKIANGAINGINSMLSKIKGGLNWILEKVGADEITASWKIQPIAYYARGTDGHPRDGFAMVNDSPTSKWREMFQLPNGEVGMFPNQRNLMTWLPKGTKVLDGERSEKISRIANIPAYKNGIGDMFANIFDKGKDLLSDAVDIIKHPIKFVTKVISNKLGDTSGFNGFVKDMAVAMPSFVSKTAGDWVKGLFESSMSNLGDGGFYGNDAKNGNGVYQYLMDIANSFIKRYSQYGLYLSSGLRFTDNFDHSKGLAVDLAIPGVVNGSSIYRKIADEAIKMDGIKYVITNGMWRHKGQPWVPWADGDHYDHVHISGNKPQGPKYQAGTGKVGGSWLASIYKAAAQMGQRLSAAEATGILAQIQRESGGNEKIIQSSAVWDENMAAGNPARGLLQYIPSTFNAYRVKGYGNIMNGYHQLLAFFNNSTWRRDLPYGRSGWGPNGSRLTGYKNGGWSLYEKDARISEGNKPEVVLPITNKNRSIQLMYEALDFMSGDNKSKQQAYSTKENTMNISKFMDKMDRIIEILLLLLDKDTNFYLNNRSLDIISQELDKLQYRKNRLGGVTR